MAPTLHTLKLTQIGNSVGAVFQRELLNLLKLVKGDAVYITETPDGLRTTPRNPAFAEQMRRRSLRALMASNQKPATPPRADHACCGRWNHHRGSLCRVARVGPSLF